MSARLILPQLLFSILCSACLFAQQNHAAVAEFPVVWQQNIVAGKTPVGARIQAKLDIATLVNGTVIPRNAVLTGEVLESAAKTASDPSRLAIRIDSVQWKSGSAPVKLFLTPWYYPAMVENGPDLQYGPEQSPKRSWNGMGQYPDPNSPTYRPFPGATDSDKGSSAPDTTSATTSNHRVAMKDIEFQRSDDGVIVMISAHSNIKLDKVTTYVLASGDSHPASANAK
jgi:hypothetical protein